jgi:hypothetical protein
VLSFTSSLFGQDYWLFSSPQTTSAIQQKKLVKTVALDFYLLQTALEKEVTSQTTKETPLVLYFPNEENRLEAFELASVPLFYSASAKIP